jgi:hypothetical protein
MRSSANDHGNRGAFTIFVEIQDDGVWFTQTPITIMAGGSIRKQQAKQSDTTARDLPAWSLMIELSRRLPWGCGGGGVQGCTRGVKGDFT